MLASTERYQSIAGVKRTRDFAVRGPSDRALAHSAAEYLLLRKRAIQATNVIWAPKNASSHPWGHSTHKPRTLVERMSQYQIASSSTPGVRNRTTTREMCGCGAKNCCRTTGC